MVKFLKWNNIYLNPELIVTFGMGENSWRNKSDGRFNIFIEFSKEINHVDWFNSESERDIEFQRLKKLLLSNNSPKNKSRKLNIVKSNLR